ncbi:PTC1, Serine threonine phosphatase [Lecanosticta acicola]|uniref:PTC1, Serine threonine phosphatase n=1 Tax=Lecanosticta acicola TaxID=111012 RepID=A0AAI9EDM3_9PEZI|nr:PTC1, Serine threonine phosphatase [Lecanosticta acicola]
MHHSFDDSPDDYDMDMDQRTRMLGRGGRIILLGDGTELRTGHGHDNDGDIDMDERGEAEEDSSDHDEEQVRKDQSQKSNGEEDKGRSQREQTPGPINEISQKVEESKQRLTGASDSTGPEDPKTVPAVDAAEPNEKVDSLTETK